MKKKILVFIMILGLVFGFGFSKINVKAEEVRSGSYMGTIKYEGVVGLDENNYRGMVRTPLAKFQNDTRYRDLYDLLNWSHSYYFGSRDAFYNFPFNVSLYVSTYEMHATLDLPAVNLLLVSKDVKVDTMTIWGNNINFYRDGDLQYSYTKQEILNYFSARGYSGYESIYLRFVFDFSYENTPEYESGYQIGYTEGYDKGNNEGYNSGYDTGYSQGLIDNPDNNFGAMIITVLSGVGTILSIELLPNITIGAIIAVPIIFGVIAFVLGRKKD